jgi:hypothetical protein
MNVRTNRQITIIFLLLAVMALGACGTLEISSESPGSQNEPVALDTTVDQSSLAPVLDQPPATTTIVPAATISTAESVNSDEETGPESPAWLSPPVYYQDEETRISFTYPPGWTMEETANAFVFHNGPISLQIAYRYAGEEFALWTRTGIPAGDIMALDGLVPFLGQMLAKSGLVYEDRLKMVFYGGEPVSIVEAQGLEFAITLDDRETDYLILDISEDTLAEAEAILASVAVDCSPSGQSGELLTYTNPGDG